MTLGGETSADYAYALTFNVFETNKTPFLFDVYARHNGKCF